MTEQEAYEQYDEMLNELYPLDGIHCNPFSTLLKAGDQIGYHEGFLNWCDSQGINTDELE